MVLSWMFGAFWWCGWKSGLQRYLLVCACVQSQILALVSVARRAYAVDGQILSLHQLCLTGRLFFTAKRSASYAICKSLLVRAKDAGTFSGLDLCFYQSRPIRFILSWMCWVSDLSWARSCTLVNIFESFAFSDGKASNCLRYRLVRVTSFTRLNLINLSVLNLQGRFESHYRSCFHSWWTFSTTVFNHKELM